MLTLDKDIDCNNSCIAFSINWFESTTMIFFLNFFLGVDSIRIFLNQTNIPRAKNKSAKYVQIVEN